MSILLLVLGFSIALILSISITPLVIKLASTYGLYDQPDATQGPSGLSRRVHLKPTPRLGGIAIIFAFFVTYLTTQQDFKMPLILLLSIFIFGVGAIDDLRSISALTRFYLQFLVCGLAVYLGKMGLSEVVFSKGFSIILPDWIGLLLSTFIILGAINALNMIDGLDGLAGGISIITVGMLSLLHYLSSDNLTVTLQWSVPLIGAVLGFLSYNTHPASIFMGDNGSNWLGFMIGIQIITVLNQAVSGTTQSAEIHIPLISALLCFAVPIFDTAFVIFNRIRNGSHPMKADKNHFHHKLLRLGLTHSQTVTFIYFISIASAILGILPIAYPQYYFDWVPYLGLALIICLLVASSRVAWKNRYRNPLRNVIAKRTTEENSFTRFLNKFLFLWERTNKYCIFVILVVSPAFAGPISETIGYAAIPILALTIGLMIFRGPKNDFIESFVFTLSCVLLLAANNQNTMQIEVMGQTRNIHGLYNWLFIFLSVSSILFIFVTLKKNYLVLTPSDFLLLTLPIALILFPEDIKKLYRLDIISIRSFVIFMAYRALEKRKIYARRHLNMAMASALVYIILVSLFKMRLVY